MHGEACQGAGNCQDEDCKLFYLPTWLMAVNEMRGHYPMMGLGPFQGPWPASLQAASAALQLARWPPFCCVSLPPVSAGRNASSLLLSSLRPRAPLPHRDH